MSKKRSSVGKDGVFVQQSPVSGIKQRGNLTGNARLLRDHVCDICDLIHQWNNELLEGVNVIKEIQRFMYDRIDALKKKTTNFPNSDQLQALSKHLEQICERMELIVEKLGQKSSSILSIQRLEEMIDNAGPIFLTWPTSKFVKTSQDIYEMYRKEMQMKITIKEQLCFCNDKKSLLFYSTAWIQEPYVEKVVNLNFEAMLKEVGHPSLYNKSKIDENQTKD